MELSIIIVSYKCKDKLRVALDAVYASRANFDYEVILLDNFSEDGTVEMVNNEYLTKPDISAKTSFFANSTNDGFGAANNQGIAKAKGEYVLLLNPDTKVAPETLQVMMDFMKAHPEVGISTCKLVKGNGELDLACRRSFPDPWVSFFRLSGLSKLFPKNKKLAAYNLTYKSMDEETEIDACVGAFMFISPKCLKALQVDSESSFVNPRYAEGFSEARATADKQLSVDSGQKELVTGHSSLATPAFFDPAFYMYGEDLDMCYRAKESGFKIWYYPKTTTIHYKGQSSRKAPKRALYAFYDAMWIFYKKHLYKKYPKVFSWLVFCGIWGLYWIKRLQNFFRKEQIVSK